MASANLGNVIIQALTVADDATVDGTLTVEGSATLAALTVTGPADLAGGLTAGGSATQTGSDLVLGNPGNGRTLDWTGLGTPAPYMDVYGNLRFPNATSGDNWNVTDVNGDVVLTVYSDGTKVVETANNTLDSAGAAGFAGVVTSLGSPAFNGQPPQSGTDIFARSAYTVGGNYGGTTSTDTDTSMVGWNFTNGQGEVDIIAAQPGGGGGLNVYKLTGSAAPYTPSLVAMFNTGFVSFPQPLSLVGNDAPNSQAGLAYTYNSQGEFLQFDSTTGVTFDLPSPRPSPLPSGWGYTVQVTQQFSGGVMYLVSAKSSNSSITAYDSTTATLYGWAVDIWQRQ